MQALSEFIFFTLINLVSVKETRRIQEKLADELSKLRDWLSENKLYYI